MRGEGRGVRGERQTKRKYINAILQVYHSERVHESQQKSKRVNYCNDELGSRVCCSLSWEPETSPPPTHLTLLNAAAKFNKTEVFEKKLHVTLSLSLCFHSFDSFVYFFVFFRYTISVVVYIVAIIEIPEVLDIQEGSRVLRFS